MVLFKRLFHHFVDVEQLSHFLVFLFSLQPVLVAGGSLDQSCWIPVQSLEEGVLGQQLDSLFLALLPDHAYHTKLSNLDLLFAR